MNGKSKTAKNQANTKNRIENVISKEELDKKIESVMKDLKSSTWRELETNGKFTKNDKLTFISDEMLIIGCDIGCETHYIRAVDARGRELSRGAFAFGNNSECFESAKQWALELAAANDKKQIVLGLEPTGHYWFCAGGLLYGLHKEPGGLGVRPCVYGRGHIRNRDSQARGIPKNGGGRTRRLHRFNCDQERLPLCKEHRGQPFHHPEAEGEGLRVLF